MIENRRWLSFFCHLMLIAGIAVLAFPLYMTLVTATLSAEEARQIPLPLLPSTHFFSNLHTVLFDTVGAGMGVSLGPMLINSMIMALVIAIGKISISLIAGFAIVYFRFPGRMVCFWAIFVTLMLPVEVRIMPTYQVIADLKLLDTYTGLTLPLIASATATFLFRQFFMSVPPELVEAARIDGAGPLRFFRDILLPLSKTQIAALFVIMFIYGWNQYLWPLLITTEESMYTAVIGIKRMISSGDTATDWNLVMTTTLLTLLPPLLVVLVMQKWFVRGLVDSEK